MRLSCSPVLTLFVCFHFRTRLLVVVFCLFVLLSSCSARCNGRSSSSALSCACCYSCCLCLAVAAFLFGSFCPLALSCTSLLSFQLALGRDKIPSLCWDTTNLPLWSSLNLGQTSNFMATTTGDVIHFFPCILTSISTSHCRIDWSLRDGECRGAKR